MSDIISRRIRHIRFRLFGCWHRLGLPSPIVYRAAYYLQQALDERRL
jgi:hypothetical protein